MFGLRFTHHILVELLVSLVRVSYLVGILGGSINLKDDYLLVCFWMLLLRIFLDDTCLLYLSSSFWWYLCIYTKNTIFISFASLTRKA